MRKVPVLDDASVSRLCIQLLDRLRINVALCTEQDEVLYATRRTKEILRRFPDGAGFRTGELLPESVRDAVHAYVAPESGDGQRRRAPIKLTTPDGAVVVSVACTPVHQLPPVALVVRLTEERVRTSEVVELMRARFKLSARDLRLVRAIAETRSVREIAEANSLTYGTTKVYLHDLYRRLDVHSRDGLLRLMDRVRRSR
jgi:DNA-binding CsgD family transcriptional regulator